MNTPAYKGNDAWKTNGLVIGSPAFQLSALHQQKLGKIGC